MASTTDPRKNLLLAELPDEEYARWRPQIEHVRLPLGKAIFESGGSPAHVYFPTTAIISLLYVLEDGASAEIAIVGNDGVVGISLFMGGASTPSRAVVQSAGERVPPEGRPADAGVQPLRPRHAPATSIHAGADHADDPDCGVQPAPLAGPAVVPLAAAQPRPAGIRRNRDDAGADRQHAGRAPRRRHRGGRSVAGGGNDPLPARPYHGARSGRSWSNAPASAMRWSGRNTNACSLSASVDS